MVQSGQRLPVPVSPRKQHDSTGLRLLPRKDCPGEPLDTPLWLPHHGIQHAERECSRMKRSSEPPASAPSPPEGPAVPSVARALDVLEYLRQSTTPLTLSELARALQISPSSLLAILRTLGAGGYVQRDGRSNRYQIGPALERLAAEGVRSRAISAAAEAIVALARSAILASPSERSAVPWREALAALGLAGRQLSALLLEEPTEERRPMAEPVWQNEASGPLAPAELDRFLAGDLLATLCCVKPDGYPYSVPVWYQWEEGRFWVVPRAGAAWARYLESNPRVSLAVSEHHPPLRRVLVEGRAEPISGPGSPERARQLAASMALRYLGPSASANLEATVRQVRQVFAIVPERIVTWHGLASHPRYRASDRTDVGDAGVA